ncbi:hypothetical protein ABZ546_13440, partial [Brachybacterium paraconglomeratum]
LRDGCLDTTHRAGHGARSLIPGQRPQRHDPQHLGGEGWETLPVTGGYEQAGRGIGLQDMAVRGADLRASGELGQHVLEVMNGVLEAAHGGARVEIASTVERPAAVPLRSKRSEPERMA